MNEEKRFYNPEYCEHLENFVKRLQEFTGMNPEFLTDETDEMRLGYMLAQITVHTMIKESGL